MENIDFNKITPCGECCVGCIKKEQGLCEGCIETDGNCKEWTESKGCPIFKCAKEHGVKFCGLCKEFPCNELTKKIHWNPNIVEHLTNLKNIYYSGKNKYFHTLARGVVIDGDYILVAKLKNGNNTFLLGGHIEFNENLKQALEREIFEEIGIEVIIGEYIGCLEAQWIEDGNYNQEINHIFIVNGINKNMEIKSKEAHLDIFWLKICKEEMEKQNLLPYSMREIVKNVYNKNYGINYISEV